MSGPSSSNAQGSASASASASNSATGTTYTLSPEAYALPLLHAALHPSSTVTGLFLSPLSSNPSSASAAVPDAASPTLNNKQDGGTSSNAVPQQADEINITHSIPLQHTYTSLTPYTEIGLELAQAYAEDQGLRVVGMYVARGDDAAPKAGEGLGRIGERMLGVLREGWQGAFGLLVSQECSCSWVFREVWRWSWTMGLRGDTVQDTVQTVLMTWHVN